MGVVLPPLRRVVGETNHYLGIGNMNLVCRNCGKETISDYENLPSHDWVLIVGTGNYCRYYLCPACADKQELKDKTNVSHPQ